MSNILCVYFLLNYFLFVCCFQLYYRSFTVVCVVHYVAIYLFVAMIIIVILIILLTKVSKEIFKFFRVHLHSSLIVRVFTFRGHSRLVGVQSL